MEQKTVSQTTTSTANPAPTSAPTTPTPAYNKKKTIFYMHQILWYILGIVETILAFRVILKMLAANPSSGFANFIYQISLPFALPFLTLFPTTAAQGSVLEWSTLAAMVVYFIIVLGIINLVKLTKPTSPTEVHETIDNT